MGRGACAAEPWLMSTAIPSPDGSARRRGEHGVPCDMSVGVANLARAGTRGGLGGTKMQAPPCIRFSFGAGRLGVAGKKAPKSKEHEHEGSTLRGQTAWEAEDRSAMTEEKDNQNPAIRTGQMEAKFLGPLGLALLRPLRIGDERGWFSEIWSAPRLRESGLDVTFVQENHSCSTRAGTLRGLHYQAPPRDQTKLVRCTRGAVRDIAVDVRRGSPTFSRWVALELSAENGHQLFIPSGFLHGFVTLTDDAEVQYLCSDTYSPSHDGSVRWDSAGIDWKLHADPILSPKDRNAPALADWVSPFEWGGAR
jgi:dTDP-4-dehydrorhamnose 3,5-epimerase